MFHYKWEEPGRIKQLLIELEAVKLMFERVRTSPLLIENLRRISLLKSAVYSARIEGFADTLASPKQESQDLVKAYRWIYSDRAPKKMSLNLIKRQHRLVGLAGQWRSEPGAIFDQAGRVVHLAVAHFKLPEFMPEYIRYINGLKEPAGVTAAAAQFAFEKIHPFADGNGRVGRLISAFIMDKAGYGLKGLAPFEEYIDKHRDKYYAVLEPNLDATGFIEFFLEAVVTQAKESMTKLESGEQRKEEELLPRRREMLEIIRDHPDCSFNFLARRFAAINQKTLHYDLAQLRKGGWVKKAGVSRGAVYHASMPDR